MQIHFDSFYQQIFLGESPADNWEAGIRKGNRGYLKLAAKKLQENECSAGREFFVSLHDLYAKYLEGVSPDDKARLQFEAIMDSARAFLECTPDMTKETSREIQEVFAKAIDAYVPDCPHLAYVTKESLEKIHESYNANQYLYAKWCYITSCAMSPLVLDCSLDQLLSLGATARSLLARLCKTEDSDDFGKKREYGGLHTPLTGQYRPWHGFMRALWEENHAYCVDAISVDGDRVPGTKVGFKKFSDRGISLSWAHGRLWKKLHKLSEEWLKKTVELGKSHSEDFERAAGSFKHSLIQYAPWNRGSAFFALTANHAILRAFKRKLPLAIKYIDCYALSFQRDDFVERPYLPWIRGELTDEQAVQLLSTKARAVQQCVHADWHDAIARGDIGFLKKQAAIAPPEFYFDCKFLRLFNVGAVFLAPNEYCSEKEVSMGRAIFLFLHERYADHLNMLVSPEDKAILQWDAIATSIDFFIQFKTDHSPLTSMIIQHLFQCILTAYVPDCPYLAYITQESLDKGYNDRDVNLRLYALWCYMTSLAMKRHLHSSGLCKLINLGEGACSLFAQLSARENADQVRKRQQEDRQTEQWLTETLDLGRKRDPGFESALGSLKQFLIQQRPLLMGSDTFALMTTNAIRLAFTFAKNPAI